MTLKLGYRDGGKTSEEGINRITSRLLSAAGVLHSTDLQVVATGTPDNHVNVGVGDIAIGNNSPNTADPDFYYHGWVTASEALTIGANSSGNPRIDVVVAYVDLSVVDSTNSDNPGALAVKVVAGTAAATPVPPTDAEIQTSVGASNPWVLLAQVAVANGFSSIANSDITDLRAMGSTLSLFANSAMRDFIGSGLLWAQKSGLIGKMTTGFAVVDGEWVNKSYLEKTFTANKDTYVDLPKGSIPTSTNDLTYTAVANNAAAPALASGSIRLAKVVTDGSAITSVTTSGDDSNGVPIYPAKPSFTHNHLTNAEGGLLGAAAVAYNNLTTLLKNGLITTTGLSYTSYDATNKTGVIATASDLTGEIGVGDKLTFSQATGGTKWCIVTAITSAAITGYFGTDYALTNETITAPCYGHGRPKGFNADPKKWTQSFLSTSTAALGGSFANTGSILLSIPIGTWDIEAKVNWATNKANSAPIYNGALSESTSATTAGYKTTVCTTQTGSSATGTAVNTGCLLISITKSYAAATTIYLISSSTGTTATLYSSIGNTHYIKAVCALI